MRAASPQEDEWIDGFLFVANRPMLDLLNTKPVLADGPTELLPDVDALERWLIASGLVRSPRHKATLRGWRNSSEAAVFLRQLIAFRERLRKAVLQIESGSPPSHAFLAEVNSLLRAHPRLTSLCEREGTVALDTFFELRQPSDLWSLIASATAELLTETAPTRIRKCESCVVHFLDTSKKGSRRWCSMNICGNRVKVANYQRRMRGKKSTEAKVRG